MLRTFIFILFIAFGSLACSNHKNINNGKKVMNKRHLPTYFLYYTKWCPHCKKLGPIAKDLENELSGIVYFYYVDLDSEQGKKIAAVYKGNIDGVPHAQFYDAEGNLQGEKLGFTSYGDLRSLIKKYLRK